MELTLDLHGRRALLVGGRSATRRVVARLLSDGAVVALVDTLVDRGSSPQPRHAADGSLQFLARPATEDAWRSLVRDFDLVVEVGCSENLRGAVEAACREERTWFTSEPTAATGPVGRVILVGAGPGHDELMTVAGRAALRQADVVFYDRLAPSALLGDWAPGARLIDVGKTPGFHALPQHEIERRMIECARGGETVVRLKGGDPFVFGRGGEEVLACKRAGIEVEVIPGISSSIAVPGAAGIPVTHRNLSHLFTVVSGHAPLSESELEHLVGLNGTIVVLMGVANLPHLAAGLIRQGMSAQMPVAVIESGFTASQRTTIAPLGEVTVRAILNGVRSPAVLVIGDVVRLAECSDAESIEKLLRL